MSWGDGQAPVYVWLSRKDVGAKKTSKKGYGGGTRLACGSVQCWTMEPLHKPTEFVCYRVVPSKSPVKRGKKK